MVATDHNMCYSLFRSTSTHSVYIKQGVKKYDLGHNFSNTISTYGYNVFQSSLFKKVVSTFNVHFLTR